MTYDPNQPGQYPPQWPPPPPEYYAPSPAMLAYGTPVAPARPTSASALAIIGIVLASLWILADLVGFSRLVLVLFVMGQFRTSQITGFEVAIYIQLIQGLIASIIGIALLTTSIACLRLVSWARRGMIIVAIVDLLFITAKVSLALAWVIPQQMKVMAPAVGMNRFPGAPTPMAIGQAVIMAVYPIIVLVFMSRPQMKQVYDLQRF